MTIDGRNSLVPIDFEKFDYLIAVQVTVVDSLVKKWQQGLPPEVGSIKAIGSAGDKFNELNLVECDKILPKSTM